MEDHKLTYKCTKCDYQTSFEISKGDIFKEPQHCHQLCELIAWEKLNA